MPGALLFKRSVDAETLNQPSATERQSEITGPGNVGHPARWAERGTDPR